MFYKLSFYPIFVLVLCLYVCLYVCLVSVVCMDGCVSVSLLATN